MAIYDSVGSYVLFSSVSQSKTRVWTREILGDTCRFPAARKYYVLKNPPATARFATPKINVATAKTVVVGNVTYAIDPPIYAALNASLQTDPVRTLPELQERIVRIRLELKLPPKLGAVFRNAPLRGVFDNRRYESIGDKWKSAKIPNETKRVFDVDFKVGKPIDINVENFPLIDEYQALFPKRRLVIQNAQYVYALVDAGCAYTGLVDDLFDRASRVGATILAIQSRQNFFNFGVLSFAPIVTVMVPESPRFQGGDYPVKFGILFGITPEVLSNYVFPSKNKVLEAITENSQLIFVPIQTELDRIENVDLPEGSGVTFPVTNGGSLSTDFRPMYQRFKALLPTGLTLENRVLTLLGQFIATQG
jgi:hypothetical protein